MYLDYLGLLVEREKKKKTLLEETEVDHSKNI